MLAFVACNDDVSNKELAEAEDLLLANYLQSSGIDQMTDVVALFDSLEIYYIETSQGPGRQAVTGDVVSVRYEVYTLDNTLLYSNLKASKPVSFTLGASTYSQYMPSNILGFHSGIGMMNEGGRATFIIPSDQAYGSVDYYDSWTYIGISKYTPLRFEVQVTDLTVEERD